MAPPPVVELRPWWRWLLYVASVVFAGPLTMVIGIALGAGVRYRSTGRVMFAVSSITFFLFIGLIVGYGLFG